MNRGGDPAAPGVLLSSLGAMLVAVSLVVWACGGSGNANSGIVIATVTGNSIADNPDLDTLRRTGIVIATVPPAAQTPSSVQARGATPSPTPAASTTPQPSATPSTPTSGSPTPASGASATPRPTTVAAGTATAMPTSSAGVDTGAQAASQGSCSVGGSPSASSVDAHTVNGTSGVILVQHVETKTYAVQGCSADDIAASLASSNTSDAGRLEVALTASTTRYTYQYKQAGPSSCAISSATIESDITVTLPQLVNQGGVAPSVLSRWQSFVAALKTHEQGHVDIVLKSANQMLTDVENQGPLSTCDALESAIKASITRETNVANDANAAYDAQTNHGVNQGVAFP